MNYEHFVAPPSRWAPETFKALVRDLGTISTRDESGQHFTLASEHWKTLEFLGWIEVHRPVHTPSGIAYGWELWSVEVTDEGQAVVDAHPELF